MSSRTSRRSIATAPIALCTLFAYVGAIAQTSGVAAQAGGEHDAHALVPVTSVPGPTPEPEGVYDAEALQALGSHFEQNDASPADDEAPAPPPDIDAEATRALAALPTGGSAIPSQAIALPTGASQLGMGESFTAQLSTGIAVFSVPLGIPAARGSAQPKLDLTYSSAGGFGLAGHGWSIGASAISRQSDRGLPGYDDRADWHAGQDRFVFGGMELVPICTVAPGRSCAGALDGEVMPAWSVGWQYFRSRIERGFLRFFWHPDGRTWRVQSKDGTNLELGAPLDASDYEGGLEVDPDAPERIYRWHLVRQYDSHGTVNGAGAPAPVNATVYRHLHDGGTVYLSDIFSTSPAGEPTTLDLSRYAHHTRLRYEGRPDPLTSYRQGWRVDHGLRLASVDVATKPFSTGGVTAPRQLVRRYHVSYDESSHTSLLVALQLEGRCALPVNESADQVLPATDCPRLPPSSFEYNRVPGGDTLLDAQGRAFEPFVETVREVQNSPPHSLDEALTDIADVNADGLPDVLVTAPGLFGGQHGVYWNGPGSTGSAAFAVAPERMPVDLIGDVDAGVLQLSNSAVGVLDLDGDGIVNLVHMPPLLDGYTVFSPERTAAGRYRWRGRAVQTVDRAEVKLDLGRRRPDARVMDVNGDGLVDVVYTSATEVQTFLSLGRYAGGADQFGQGSWTSATSADLSTDPIVHCLPWSATPVRFSDRDTYVAEMNGDGLPDLVRVRSGQLLYWPGRGNGYFGTGRADECEGSGFAEDQHIEVDNAPRFGAGSDVVLLDDVNADGLADVVEVRNQGVDIFLNDGGYAFTERHTIASTPFRPSASNYVRLLDIDGSGSGDILWGRAHEYRYIDLTGGRLPFLLSAAHNGVGKTLQLEYESSAAHMRRADAAGSPWHSLAPTVSPVLIRSTLRDNLERIGRPAGIIRSEYRYRDAVYDGRQREFRGFREAVVTNIGDATSPTSLQRSVFQLGDCAPELEGNADVCSPTERWQDNWREALKGLPVLSESYDAQGVHLSTKHTTYELRQLYAGLDGRRVSAPFPVQEDGWLYDTAAFDGDDYEVSVPEVDIVLIGIGQVENRDVVVRATAGTAHVRSQTVYDDFGNTIDSIREGCDEGCPAAAFGIEDEVITAHSDYALPPGDGSGWLWREHASYATGDVNTQHRQQISHTYNPTGTLATTTVSLRDTLPLDPTLRPATPQPPNLSGGVNQTQSILALTNTHNQFGHVISWRSTNNGCGSGEVDALYAELPVLARSYVGSASGGCGTTVLTQSVIQDRGLRAVTDSTDAAGQPSRYQYDGFGRVVRMWSPDPEAPGFLQTAPSFIATYQLPTDFRDTPYTTVIGYTQDGDDANEMNYHQSRSFTDGFGRVIFALSQKEADARGDWLASGNIAYNAKAQPYLSCDAWFYAGVPTAFPEIAVPATACTSTQFDAFGRATHSYRRSGVQDLMVVHHALSTDVWDAGDYYDGPHQGTPLTTITDGHGRGVVRTERVMVGSAPQERHLINQYLPTGEVVRVIQRTAGQTDVKRWLRYDSLGRMVLNVEPNTSPNYTTNETADVSALRAVRYAYNDSGKLVGDRDARGCGTNYHYDAGGRLVAEDRVPCETHHAPYTAPNLVTGDNTEVFYRYDTADPDTGSIADAAGRPFEIDTSLLRGTLVSVSNLGSKAVFRYDARGRGTGVALRVQRPGTPAAALSARYAPRWYIKESTLDVQGRPRTVTTGVTTPELLGSGGQSALTFQYSKRGAIERIDSSYGTLVAGIQEDASNKVEHITLGDAAATRRSFTYDVDTRTTDIVTVRDDAPFWTTPPPGSDYTPPPLNGPEPTLQEQLEDIEYVYDDGAEGPGLITAIIDHRVSGNWPASAKPVNRTFVYDDLHRLTNATYTPSQGGTDTWRSPFARELADSSRPQPVPHVSFAARVQQQSYAYDWLGNISQSRDNADGFYDNSTGTRTHGTAAAGPHQLRRATNRALAPSSPARGDLDVAYDVAGNATDLIVRRDGSCLPAGASCWQRFHYQWDEVGQIVRARRWDLTTAERTSNGTLVSGVPTRTPNAELRYGYDGAGTRVLKTAYNAAGSQAHTVYPFGGLELRSTTWTGTDYALAPERVSLRLAAGPAVARIVYALEDLPSLTSGHQHVFLQFSDQVNSTSFVIDQATGELVEYINYLAYGAVDGDYRPGRWQGYREPYQFAGKEADIEVGLSYFGARYYSPYLATWMSPDPVTIHDLGSEINPYTYVGGRPIMSVDPDGRIVFGAIIAAAIIGALIAGAINLTVQLVANEFQFDQIDWGIKGVGGAMLVGAVSGGVSGGLAGVATGFWSGAGVSALAGTAGYLTGVAVGANDFNGWGLTGAIVGGGLAGGLGTAGGTGATTGITTTTLSGLVGYTSNGLATGEWGLDSLALSIGASYAGAGAASALAPVTASIQEGADDLYGALFPGDAPERYRVPGVKIVRKEVTVDPGPEGDKYGHWWIELGPDESYGWWPEGGVDIGDTLEGVPGELNRGQSMDPHHNDSGDVELDVYAENGVSPEQVKQQIRDYAKAYGGEWSWPWGQNCHTFQTDMLNATNLTTSARFSPRLDWSQDFILRKRQRN